VEPIVGGVEDVGPVDGDEQDAARPQLELQVLVLVVAHPFLPFGISTPYNRLVSAIDGPSLGALSALGSAVAWAVITIMVRALTPAFNSVTLNAVRTTVAGALLVAWVLATDGITELTSVSTSDFLLLAFSIVVASSLGDTVFFESSQRVGVAPALTISMTYPLMAAVFAAAFLGEPVTIRSALGSLLTLGGLALIVTARGEQVREPGQWWLGFGCAMLAALSWAVSAILLKAPLREMDAITAQALRMPISGALLFAMPWAQGAAGRIAHSSSSVLWRLAVLCLLTTVSSTLFAVGVKYAGVAVGTVLSSTAPMWALLLGAIGVGDRLPPIAIVGLVVTVIGIIILQL
jgi:drug/metabolite transporter (DMT)-like permease